VLGPTVKQSGDAGASSTDALQSGDAWAFGSDAQSFCCHSERSEESALAPHATHNATPARSLRSSRIGRVSLRPPSKQSRKGGVRAGSQAELDAGASSRDAYFLAVIPSAARSLLLPRTRLATRHPLGPAIKQSEKGEASGRRQSRVGRAAPGPAVKQSGDAWASGSDAQSFCCHSERSEESALTSHASCNVTPARPRSSRELEG
jgi:hypothetical protein